MIAPAVISSTGATSVSSGSPRPLERAGVVKRARSGWLARLRRRWSRWDTALLLGSLLLVAGAGLPLPGTAVGPGSTRAVTELIDIGDAEVFPPAGSVEMATVALYPLSPFRAFQAWLDADIEVVPSDSVVSRERLALDMDESRDVAVTVALGLLGLDSPDGGRPPIDVAIRDEGVDGNSAGLAFTLGIVDLLTPGELTGGNRVGVTGTIEVDGEVGPVGSIAQKSVAMRRAGVDHLLVPAGQGAEAVAHAEGALEVVEVATLEAAFAALEALGGKAPPLPLG